MKWREGKESERERGREGKREGEEGSDGAGDEMDPTVWIWGLV